MRGLGGGKSVLSRIAGRGSQVEDREVIAVRAVRSAGFGGDLASEARSDEASEGHGEGADPLLDDEHLYAAAVASLSLVRASHKPWSAI